MITFDHDEMPVKCSGCAYRPGTEANRDEVTLMYSELCVQSGEPFFCHANAIADKLPKGAERLCRGYLDECAARGTVPAWKVAVAREGLRLMEDTMAGVDVNEQEGTNRLLKAGQAAAR